MAVGGFLIRKPTPALPVGVSQRDRGRAETFKQEFIDLFDRFALEVFPDQFADVLARGAIG
jgi:hypothetical protein